MTDTVRSETAVTAESAEVPLEQLATELVARAGRDGVGLVGPGGLLA